MLDEMAVISSESLEESPGSNVRFCLRRLSYSDRSERSSLKTERPNYGNNQRSIYGVTISDVYRLEWTRSK